MIKRINFIKVKKALCLTLAFSMVATGSCFGNMYNSVPVSAASDVAQNTISDTSTGSAVKEDKENTTDKEDKVNNVTYVVKHFKQNISDNTYYEAETEELKGVAGSEIKPEVKEYKGFISPKVQAVIINTDGTTVISYYYNRNKYNINFDANGGKGQIEAMKGIKYDEEKNLTENSFTKKKSKFSGWNTKADGTGDSYTDKQKIKNLSEENDSEVTLYAQWSKEDIKYDGVIDKISDLKDDYVSLDASKKYLMTDDNIINTESSNEKAAYINDADELVIAGDGKVDLTYTTDKGTFKYYVVVKDKKVYLALSENSSVLDAELANWSDKTIDNSGVLADRKDIKKDYAILDLKKLYKVTEDTVLKTESTNKNAAYINKDGNLVLGSKDGNAIISYTTEKETVNYYTVIKKSKAYLTLAANKKSLESELKNWSDKTIDTSGAITEKAEVKTKYLTLDTAKIYDVTKADIIKCNSKDKNIAYINKEGKLVLGSKNGSTYVTYVTDDGIFRYYVVVKDKKAYFTVEDNAKVLDLEINPISTVEPATPPAISTAPAISTTPAITATPESTPEAKLKGTEFFGGEYTSFITGNDNIFNIENGEIISKQGGTTTVIVVMANGKKFEYEVIMKNGKIQTYSKKEIINNVAIQITTGNELFGEGYISYKSPDEDVFSIDANGNIVSKKDGTVMADVVKKDGSTWIFGIEMKDGKIASYTSQLISEAKPDKKAAKDLFGGDYKSYTSSDRKVFVIDENGNITSKVDGSVVVTVIMKDGSKWSYNVTIKNGEIVSSNKKLVKATVTVNGIRYTVTDGKATVEKVVNKKISSLIIQKSVKINGKMYKVTGMSNNLFKNNKKLKKITIKTETVNIKAGTFESCKNLTNVNLQGVKILKIAKNAFKGCKKKITFKISGKIIKSNVKKIVKKSGLKKFAVK